MAKDKTKKESKAKAEVEEVIDTPEVEEAVEAEDTKEENGIHKAVYRELRPNGRTGAIAYKNFEKKSDAIKFVAETGGKLV